MSLNTGYFRTHRSIFISEIWEKPAEWLKIWLYIIGNANYQDSKLFPRGSNFFQYEEIAKHCGCSYRTVQNCIEFLKDKQQVVCHKKTRGIVLEIKNYEIYQGDVITDVNSTVNSTVITGVNSINNKTNNTKNTKNITDTSIEVSSQAMIVKNETDKIISIIKETVEKMGGVYREGKRERGFANHIAKQHKDWGEFLKKRKDGIGCIDSIQEIVTYSLDPNNKFVPQITNCVEFWDKWQKVIMAMRKDYLSKKFPKEPDTPNYGGLIRKQGFDD